MRLNQLSAHRYRSLREFDIEFGSLNLLIGANASGKSNVLDALRFLADGLRAKDFERSLAVRGGALHLAWKGEPAERIDLKLKFLRSDQSHLLWQISIDQDGIAEERVWRVVKGNPPASLLETHFGKGWAFSGGSQRNIELTAPTGCALAAAFTDPDFAARDLGIFVTEWTFFDLEPQTLRRVSYASADEAAQLDAYGRNLAQRLYSLREKIPEKFKLVVQSTKAVLGLPEDIQPRYSDEGRYYFVQDEPGLMFPVNQAAVSSGTLRVLALMTALYGESSPGLVGIEEPENYVHPRALANLAQVILDASQNVQIVITTHSPHLLNALGIPDAVRVLQRSPDHGTRVAPSADPQTVVKSLKESGFGLGEFYETNGFGA